jgi:hypothetical protein
MAKSMRVFDVDFIEIAQTLVRTSAAGAPALNVTSASYGGICQQQMVFEDEIGGALFYEAIDLSQLTLEGKTFQPLQVVINRPYTVPRGSTVNVNPCVQNEEYLFVWYTNVAAPSDAIVNGSSAVKQLFIQALRRAGMNTTPAVGLSTAYDEQQPDLGQLLWASQSAFLPSLDTALSVPNGFIENDDPPPGIPDKTILLTNSMRRVDSSEWGSMSPVQGPMLHFFRLVTCYSNDMAGIPLGSPLIQNSGYTAQYWSPINLQVVCEEVDLSSEEYLTNAYRTLTRMTPGGPN